MPIDAPCSFWWHNVIKRGAEPPEYYLSHFGESPASRQINATRKKLKTWIFLKIGGGDPWIMLFEISYSFLWHNVIERGAEPPEYYVSRYGDSATCCHKNANRK